MFSDRTIHFLIGGALLLHGIAHAIALGALVAQSLGGRPAARVAVRSWLAPSLRLETAARAALPFWAISTAGFLAAALASGGFFMGDEAWRQLAVAAAFVSSLGIAFFAGTWPGSPNRQRSRLNTFVAMAMNVAILATQLWLQWP